MTIEVHQRPSMLGEGRDWTNTMKVMFFVEFGGYYTKGQLYKGQLYAAIEFLFVP